MAAASLFPKNGKTCDFCVQSPATKIYACRNFEWDGSPVFGTETKGRWAACESCAELVDAERWDQLTERVVRIFHRRYDTPRAQRAGIEAQFKSFHQLFASNMLTRGL
jgi:hypothetical protein